MNAVGVVTGWQDFGGSGLLVVKGGGEKEIAGSVREGNLRGDRCGPQAHRVDLPEGLKGSMTFHVLTIFPEFFRGPFEHGVVERGARGRRAGHPGSTI